MTKPSMSHHFTVLKDADLIRSRRDGQQIYHSLNTTVLQDVIARLWDFFGDHRSLPQGSTPEQESPS